MQQVLGLNKNDNIDINFENLENEKFFYDVIYNPPETEFLKNAKKNFHRTVNGKMMFIYQAQQVLLSGTKLCQILMKKH